MVPPGLREEKVEKGNAVVEFVVDQSGNVIDAYVVSTTHPSFGEAALQAVVQWKFIPEIQSGKPTATLMKIPFSFTNSPESDEAVMSDDSGISDLTK